MINIPLADIKEKIKEQKSISEEEINTKIQDKLTQLSGLISEEGAAHIIANELGVKLVVEGEKLNVKNILAGMRNIEVTGKVTRKFELREFNTNNRSGKIASFMIADETGFIRVVLWNDKADDFDKFKEEDIIKVEGGYVRENNGRKEIHLGGNSKLTINPAGVAIEARSVERKKLNELKEGDENIEVLATIVQVFDIRFFEVDPETGRRVIEKEGVYYAGDKQVETIGHGYVLNLFLDDGTDNVRTVLWKNQIQHLLGLNDEEVLKFKDDAASFETVKNELLGTIIKVTGKAHKNTNFDRIELVAQTVTKEVNPQDEIDKIKEDALRTESSGVTKDELLSKPKTEITNTETTSEPEPTPSVTETPTETVAPVSEEQPIETVVEAQSNEPITSETQATTPEATTNTEPAEENISVKEETISIEDLENLDNPN